jgi:hypothetical protein
MNCHFSCNFETLIVEKGGIVSMKKNIIGACLAGFGTQIIIIVHSVLRVDYNLTTLLILGIVTLVIGVRKTDGIMHGIVLMVSGLQILLTYSFLLFFGILLSAPLFFVIGFIALVIGGASIVTHSKKKKQYKRGRFI